MKPTKNRIYCHECRRPKMLFETEKKALLFMQYNNEEIASENDKVPTRAYFCQSCGGWHLTHYSEAPKGLSRTEKMINNMHKVAAERKAINERLAEERRQKEKQIHKETAAYVASQLLIVEECINNNELHSALLLLDELLELSKIKHIKSKTLKKIRLKKEVVSNTQQESNDN